MSRSQIRPLGGSPWWLARASIEQCVHKDLYASHIGHYAFGGVIKMAR